MWTQITMGIFLAGNAIFDIRKKEVYLFPMIVTGVIGILVQILWRSLHWGDFWGGIGIGVALLLLAKVTNEAIGYGDGMVVIVVGLWKGFFQTVELLLISLMIAALYSILLLVVKKVGKKHTMPFIPFLFIADLLLIFLP